MTSSAARLSRHLWRRAPGQRFRFWFSPDAAPHLIMEPVTEKGAAAFRAWLKEARRQHGDSLRAVTGAVVFGPRSQCVFCSEKMPRTFLTLLSDWAKSAIGETPALIGLRGAGMARIPVDIKDSDAIRALSLDDAEVRTDEALWTDLLTPSAALVAETLRERIPGDRLWFWLDPAADIPLSLIHI